MIRSRKMANRYRNRFILFIGLFLIFELLIDSFNMVFFSPSFFVFPLLPIPLAAIGYAYYWPRYQTWRSGAEGEEKVAEILGTLVDCRVLNDIVLPGEKENIDHVVLSRRGVFVVETKNNKGTVKCFGNSWELEKVGRRGTPYAGYIGNPSKQVKRNALMLRKFILYHLGLQLYVNDIVCFSNPDCELEVHQPTVSVVRLEELANFILTFGKSGLLSANEISRIESELY